VPAAMIAMTVEVAVIAAMAEVAVAATRATEKIMPKNTLSSCYHVENKENKV